MAFQRLSAQNTEAKLIDSVHPTEPEENPLSIILAV